MAIRNKDLIIQILREVTGAASITWRPSLDILQEEGLYLDPLPVAEEVRCCLYQHTSVYTFIEQVLI